MIFDDAIRVDLDAARHGESHYGYLARSARPESARVRALVEAWFSDYPDGERDELRQRLRSGDDAPFLSAFFELYLHALLRRLGHQVAIHPPAPSGRQTRPDFLVRTPTGREFYLEAVLATGMSMAEAGAQARINEVYDALNDVDSPNFFIGVRMRGTPATPVPKRQLKAQLLAFLSQLDPDACAEMLETQGLDALPSLSFSHDGWDLEFFPDPKSPALRGEPGIRPLGVQFYDVRAIDPRTPVRDAVIRKATRYGTLDRPYIVAVNSVSRSFYHTLHNIDVMEALFGKEQYVLSPGDGTDSAPRMERAPDGAWFGPRGPQNTRVSAVLVVSKLEPWTVARETPTLYFNPWADRPCQEVLATLTRAVPVEDRMVHEEGSSAAALFGLPDGWPAIGDDAA